MGRKTRRRGRNDFDRFGGLLWHAYDQDISEPLTEKSMDVDPITFDEAVAELSYDSIIGSEFELEKGWHVNLMPDLFLKEFPSGWQERASVSVNGKLKTIIPSVKDLLAPK